MRRSKSCPWSGAGVFFSSKRDDRPVVRPKSGRAPSLACTGQRYSKPSAQSQWSKFQEAKTKQLQRTENREAFFANRLARPQSASACSNGPKKPEFASRVEASRWFSKAGMLETEFSSRGEKPDPMLGNKILFPNLGAEVTATAVTRPQTATGVIRPQSATGVICPQSATGVIRPHSATGRIRSQSATGMARPKSANGMIRPQTAHGTTCPQSANGAIPQQSASGTMHSQSANRAIRPQSASGSQRPQSANRMKRPQSANGAIGQDLQCSSFFDVGHVRNAEKVLQAWSTSDKGARLRRFEQILQDDSICYDGRFEEEIANIGEEVVHLASLAEFNLNIRLEQEAREAEELEASAVAHKEFLERHAEIERAKHAAARCIQRCRKGQLARRQIRQMRATVRDALEDLVEEEVNADGEVDLRKSKHWSEKFLWVCDIKERKGEKDQDFLFLADISQDTIRDKARARRGRCVFQSVMFDIQDFTPDTQPDGKVEFELRFGVNTKERKDVPQGFKISFSVMPIGTGRFQGTCKSSWWGTRPVELIAYEMLSKEQRDSFPDLVAKYYKSQPWK